MRVFFLWGHFRNQPFSEKCEYLGENKGCENLGGNKGCENLDENKGYEKF